MASKRTSKDLHDVPPSTKRIKHGNPLFPTTTSRSRSATNDKFIAFHFEQLCRKVIQEEIPPILHRHLTLSCGGLTLNGRVGSNSSGRRGFRLCFMNNLPKRIFTQSKIKAEGDELLRIELRDAENKQRIVTDEGSYMKIQICVLYGDFEKEDWTDEEFDNQIVIPREEKGPLLKGDKVITLKNGVAYINNMEFTDICKGRTKKFRLGVKIVQSNSIGSHIKEGRSEPFRVLDVRGKAYKKHDRPSMNDEVWRLRGIGKDGKHHDQLVSHGIKTVKDFLQLYITNEASLREKIGKIGEKSWNTIIAHVKECDVANKNLNDLKPLPIDTTHALVETLTSVQTAQYGGQNQTLQQFDLPIDQQGLSNADPTNFNLSSACQPEMWSSTSVLQGDMAGSEFCDQMLQLEEMPSCCYGEGNLFYGFDGVSQTDQFGRSYSFEQLNANLFSFDYGDGAGPSNYFSSSNFAEHTSSKVKLKKDWQKIRSALKWVMLYVDVAKKRASSVHIHSIYNEM